MRKRPSPSMVVAIIALVFAVAGTAVASVATISVLTKKEKKQTRNIAQQEITKAAPGLSVANADKLSGQGIASFLRNGDAAGGDLTGTYPNPTIKSSAIPPAQSQELGGSFGNVPTNLSYFLAPVGLTTPDTQAAHVSLGVSSTPLTISNFSASVSVPPGPSVGQPNGWLFGWIINGGSLVFACQFFHPDTSCTDSATHQVPAGATLALQASPVNTPATARVRFGWTASP